MPTIRLLTLSILVAALAAPPAMAKDGKMARVGLLGLTEGECGNQSFREGMREMGYTEGRNLVIECRHGGGRYPGLHLAAKEMANTKPDVIVALTHITADAAHAATDSIPIVFIASSDPVFGGFAASFPRPGGNMTGLTYYSGELNAKRLELLKALAPGIKRVAVVNSAFMSKSVNEQYIQDVTAAAKDLGLEIGVFVAPEGDDLEPVFAAMAEWKAEALYLLPTIIFALITLPMAGTLANLLNFGLNLAGLDNGVVDIPELGTNLKIRIGNLLPSSTVFEFSGTPAYEVRYRSRITAG